MIIGYSLLGWILNLCFVCGKEVIVLVVLGYWNIVLIFDCDVKLNFYEGLFVGIFVL